MKNQLKLSTFLIGILFFNVPAFSDEKNNGINFYTGMFDFSDEGKKSTLIGFQHQNEDLNRDTFLGNLSPITGLLILLMNLQRSRL